jgi:hypothetical protein
MYGLASMLAIALMPAASVWDGFFWLNALACTVSALLLFSLLRERVHAPLALLLTLAAVLWLPGFGAELPDGGGVLVTPSAGPFRFLWCQILLVMAARRPSRPAALIAGCLVWLVACLWSSESAVYASAAWLPAYALLTWEKDARLKWWALPPLLAVSAMAVVFAYYSLRLGHGPDWYGFVETALGFRGGVQSLPIDPWGPAAALVLVLWASAAGALRAVATAARPADAAPVVAALLVLWATGSYFVGRSHSLLVTDLMPTLLFVGLVVLRGAPSSIVVRPVVVALCTAVLLLTVYEPSTWKTRGPLSRRWALHVDRHRPTLEPPLRALFAEAGIQPGAAIAFIDLNVMPAWSRGSRPPSADRLWLPVQPMAGLVAVGVERRMLYVERFVARTRTGGWLVQHEDPARLETLADTTWLAQALAKTHRPMRTVVHGAWRATYYGFAGG